MGRPSTMTMTAQLHQLRTGEVTAEALMLQAIDRCREVSHLNAFLTTEPDMALRLARDVDAARRQGAELPMLAGLPICVKDNIDIEGWLTTGATPALADVRAKRTAPVAQRLLDAGAILLGKTNLHELAFGITNTNFGTFPSARNPHDPKRVTGGSSGGTAAAIAAGIVSAGLGTDTSGSIRIPAALCGIPGLRPSVGVKCQDRRYSADGVLPISHTNDTPGPMASSVEDLTLLDAIITGTHPVSAALLRGLRLGLPDCFWNDLDPEVERICRALCDRLAEQGAVLINLALPGLRDAWKKVSAPVVLHEPIADIPAWLAQNGRKDISLADIYRQIANPDVRAAFEVVITDELADSYRAAKEIYRPELCRIYREAFRTNDLDALIFPSVPVPAPLINEESASDMIDVNGQKHSVFDTCIRNTDPGANAGLPGLCLPAGITRSGLPVGIELDGPVGADRTLLSIGMAIERLFQR